jgi:phage-related baseplate assembly protein
MAALDLSLLPPPDVIKTLDYERILAARKARFLSLCPEEERADWAARLEIEGEPVLIVLQETSYAILIIDGQYNDAARSNLLPFATGGDLDNLGAFYGVLRMPGESDARFRRRIGVHIAAINGNGTDETYIARALAVDLAVKDAAVISPKAGEVTVALWISDLAVDATRPPNTSYDEANAARHAAVLAQVEAVFAAKDGSMLGVPIRVYEAVPRAVNIAAVIFREPSAPVHLVEELSARLPDLIRAHAELGRDVSRSRILSWLHVEGVSRVELHVPSIDAPIPADGYAAPGDIDLIDGGLSW